MTIPLYNVILVNTSLRLLYESGFIHFLTLEKIVNASGKPAFQVTLQGKEKIYTPEDISSILLSKMKAIAEQSFKRKVTRAVLAVPGRIAFFFLKDVLFLLVEFNEAQRNATRIAAASIHLETLAVVSNSF